MILFCKAAVEVLALVSKQFTKRTNLDFKISDFLLTNKKINSLRANFDKSTVSRPHRIVLVQYALCTI